MARINTNISSLIAQSNLARSNTDLTTRLQRLSTGLRINRGADDPAGLIVSERLRTELQGLDQAISNSERASLVIATTEGYLAEVADLLNSIKSLIVEAANTGGMSKEEIEANQLQIDSAIESITRISNTASFAGLKLLNGSLDYLTSGINTADIAAAQVHSAQFGNNSHLPVSVEVIGAAERASLFLSGVSGGGPAIGSLLSSVTIEIAGNIGVQTLSFVSGTSFADVANAINTVKDSTGVTASLVDDGDPTLGLTFTSIGYGSDQFVSVRKVGETGDFFQLHREPDDAAVTERDTGADVIAMINGAIAAGKGLQASINAPSLSVRVTLTEEFATEVTGTATTFDITGGGAMFQLGPQINATQQVGFGMQSMAASKLGGANIDGVRYFLESLRTGQVNSIVGGKGQAASQILESAIDEVSMLRGRLGSFERNTLQTNIRALQIGLENISSGESQIRDADFARETAALTRAQILTQAGTSVLATANVSAQNVLALLG